MSKTARAARSKGRIVIIDDEEAMGHILVKSLALDRFEAIAYTDPVRGIESIEHDQPDAILTDVRMPTMSGKEVLRKIKQDYPEIPVLIMTAHGTIEDAVSALKEGAFNYITKPFQHDFLVHQIELALERRHLEQENRKLSDQELTQREVRDIIGHSAGLKRVKEMIAKAASTDSSVLITGESGVGKELVAREIHRQSARRHRRFVTVNCPAIPATLIESEMFGYERGAFTGANQSKMGLIELSAGGTMFLDEIGELPVELQVKLLHVLQEHEIQRVGGLRQMPVDLRVIAAANRDLDQEIEVGRFRLDLYYRMNVIPIHVPPLRDRPEDIPDLIEHFLSKIERRSNRPGLKLADEVTRFFLSYPWPGNIRQLENALERMAVFSPDRVFGEESIPADLMKVRGGAAQSAAKSKSEATKTLWPTDFHEARDRFERSYLEQLLDRYEGNITQIARVSGISRRTLYEKFDKLGIKRGDESDE